jgi:hypothetical protein
MVQKGKSTPHDQFDYSYRSVDEKDSLRIEMSKSLISGDDTDLNAQFNNLIGMQLLLCNIGPKMLVIEQEKVRNLVILFDMARRSKYMHGTFRRSYYAWKHQLQLTRAQDGKASDQVNAVVAGHLNKTQGFDGVLTEALQKQEQNIFQKLFAPKQQA